MPEKQERRRSVDGFTRTSSQEDEINELAVATFGRGSGAKFLDYLKQITNSATGPEASDAELRHYSGQRHLVQIIDQRTRDGANKRRAS